MRPYHEHDLLLDQDYDLILFLEALEHLNYHPRLILENLYRAAAPGDVAPG